MLVCSARLLRHACGALPGALARRGGVQRAVRYDCSRMSSSGSSRRVQLSAVLSPVTLHTTSVLCASRRCYAATSRDGHGADDAEATSASGAATSAHFDLQDVDADRLKHMYWDMNDDDDSPYGSLDESWSVFDDEGAGAGREGGRDTLHYVDPRDRPLVQREYL